jgi:gas vesicle protein
MIRRLKSFATFFKGILIGWIAGAAVALVYAPRPGEETRAVIREKGLELKDQATVKVEETRTKAEELARVSSERVNELKYQSQKTLSEQKATLESALEGVKEGVKTYKEEGGETQPLVETGENDADLPAVRDDVLVDLPPDTTSGESGV